ncbi:MAG: hypothetical protein GY871_04520 [Actinomycetales bacterium]|nr:hypothetical protein [Actinomycetales bacterium]
MSRARIFGMLSAASIFAWHAMIVWVVAEASTRGTGIFILAACVSVATLSLEFWNEGEAAHRKALEEARNNSNSHSEGEGS